MVSNVYAEAEFIRFGSGFLLNDLFSYVNQDCNDHRKQIIFIGDPAQLPPVNSPNSPALDAGELKESFDVSPREETLTHVVRQKTDSGILKHASELRSSIDNQQFTKLKIVPNNDDVRQTDALCLVDDYLETGNGEPSDESIMVCYTNARAKELNDAVRNRVFPGLGEPQPNDIMLAVRNCYTRELQIYNGDFCRVVRSDPRVEERIITIKKIIDGKLNEVKVPLAFRKMQLCFVDRGVEHVVETLVSETLINSRERDLTSDETKALYIDFKIRNPKLKPGTPAFKTAIKDDKYFNCLRIKYGYAVTCHKAQGGEWTNAFVDFSTSMGYFTEPYFRWAYTALTRAKETLYALNPPRFGTLTPETAADNTLIQPRKDLIVVRPQAADDVTKFGIGADEPLRLAIYQCVAERIENLDGKLKEVKQHNWQEAYSFVNAWEEARVAIIYNSHNKVSTVTLQRGQGQEWAEAVYKALTELQGKTIAVLPPHSPSASPAVFSCESDCTTPCQIQFIKELQPRIKELDVEKVVFNEQSPFQLKGEYIRNGLPVVINYYFKGSGRFSSLRPDAAHSQDAGLLKELTQLH